MITKNYVSSTEKFSYAVTISSRIPVKLTDFFAYLMYVMNLQGLHV